MSFYPTDRIIVFIDGANLHATVKALNLDLDYKALRSIFEARGRLIRAYNYTALPDHNEYAPVRPLLDWLRYNGFIVVTKRVSDYIDGLGRRRLKGNIGVEIAVDMLEQAQNADHLVLFTGDGDMTRVVKDVQRKGARVTVVSTLRTDPALASDSLRRQCDTFVDLQDLIAVIGVIKPFSVGASQALNRPIKPTFRKKQSAR